MFIFWKQSLWDLHPLRAVSACMCWWWWVWLACLGGPASVPAFLLLQQLHLLGFWKEHSALAEGCEKLWQSEISTPRSIFCSGKLKNKTDFLTRETWNNWKCGWRQGRSQRGWKEGGKGREMAKGMWKNRQGKLSFLNRGRHRGPQCLPSRSHFFKWTWLGAWHVFLVLFCL